MTNPFDIDQMVADTMEQSLRTGEGIELPFPTMYLWAHNGAANLKTTGIPTLYFGGWAGKMDQIDEAAQKLGEPRLPGLSPTPITTRDNKEYSGYTTRQVIIAPIAFRRRWNSKEGHVFSTEYREGYRQHIQLLCLLGSASASAVSTYAPAVLSGKGYQASNILTGLKEFDKHIDSERRRVCAHLPTNLFWRRVGTFGDKPNFQQVGKNATSPITPITVHLPESINLETCYVGKNNAARMAELYGQAQAWLTAWKQPNKTNTGPDYDDMGNPLHEQVDPF